MDGGIDLQYQSLGVNPALLTTYWLIDSQPEIFTIGPRYAEL